MRYLPARARWAILVASRLYRGIGRRLRRRQRNNPLPDRVVVPWFEKLGLVATATLSWLRVTLFPSTAGAPVRYRDHLLGLPGNTDTDKGADKGADSPTVEAEASSSPGETDKERRAGNGKGAVVKQSSHVVEHTH
jgi:hypothetical protein